jgi:hypothetical protein
MAFALVLIGLLLIVMGARDTYLQFGQQLTKDITGQNYAFIKWFIAIAGVGALGYIQELRTFSHYFLALIIIALLLNNKGFFAALSQGIQTAPVSPTAGAPTQSASGSPLVTGSGPAAAAPNNNQSAGVTFPSYLGKWRPCALFPSIVGPC